MQKQLMIGVLLIFAVVLAACSSNVEPTLPPDNQGYPSLVEWKFAVELLYTGDVVGIAQLHNLTVYIEMEDGSVIKSVEPQIDAIFHEIEKCGRPCKNIVLTTE
jgi:hypothetical protein